MPYGLCLMVYVVWPTPYGLHHMACAVWPVLYGLCLMVLGPMGLSVWLMGCVVFGLGPMACKQKQISEPVLVGGLAPMAKQGQACPRQRRVLPPSEACHPGHQSQNLYNGVGSKSALQTGFILGFGFRCE